MNGCYYKRRIISLRSYNGQKYATVSLSANVVLSERIHVTGDHGKVTNYNVPALQCHTLMVPCTSWSTNLHRKHPCNLNGRFCISMIDDGVQD